MQADAKCRVHQLLARLVERPFVFLRRFRLSGPPVSLTKSVQDLNIPEYLLLCRALARVPSCRVLTSAEFASGPSGTCKAEGGRWRVQAPQGLSQDPELEARQILCRKWLTCITETGLRSFFPQSLSYSLTGARTRASTHMLQHLAVVTCQHTQPVVDLRKHIHPQQYSVRV